MMGTPGRCETSKFQKTDFQNLITLRDFANKLVFGFKTIMACCFNVAKN